MSRSISGIGRLRRGGLAAIALAGGLALAACGGSPTVSTGPSGGGDSASNKKLQDVYAKLEGVTGLEERREKLIALAKEEGGSVTWYTAFNSDDVDDLVKDFKSKTGISVKVYRAGSATVRQRTEQEASGGGIRADLMSATGSDPGILAKEGYYAPLKSPITERLIPEAVFPNWFGDQVYPFVVAWNTGAYPQAPKNYVDLLTNYTDGMAIEMTDADWLYGMVAFLKEKEGMSEDEALKLVGDAVKKSTPFDGHTSMTELVAAGQFKISPDNYHYRVLKTIDAGGKLTWSKDVGPIISEFGGTGIANGVQHPASALLLAEYLMVDNQQTQWPKSQRTATLKGSKIGVDATEGAEQFFIDYDGLLSEITRYQKLFGDMIAATGKKARS